MHIQPNKQGIMMQKSYTLQVPGPGFTPLGPSITFGESDDTIVWSLKHTELKSVMDECWALLSPDKNDFFGNLATLPKISIADGGLLYPLPQSSKASQLYIVPETNKNSPTVKFTGKDKVLCKLSTTKLLASADERSCWKTYSSGNVSTGHRFRMVPQ
jgi:hypothetical protein